MIKVVIGIVVVAAVAGFLLMRQSPEADRSMGENLSQAGGKMMESAEKKMGQAMNTALETAKKMNAPVKEFAMTSFYDDKGVWFSVKEMKVKKGDIVRVKVTNVKGVHDFTLDEFGVKQETPLNQEVVVEFVADKAGTFEYYCSKPGHQARGQFGKLIVE